MVGREPRSPSGRVVQRHAVAVGVYMVATTAGSVIALTSPSGLVGVECAPSEFQPEIDLCIESRQFSQPPLLVAATALLLVVGMVAGALAWRWWRRAVDWTTIDGVVDTPETSSWRLHRRMTLLIFAAWPIFAGLATDGSTTSDFVRDDRICETRSFGPAASDGVVSTVVACKQLSIETSRTEVAASRWWLPLVLVGLTLMVGTIVWWVRAWRLERTLRKPQYSYVSSTPE